MKKQDFRLRDDAEKKLAQSSDTITAIKTQTPEQLVHELRLHQIELEMMNEELRRANLASEAARDRYADLYDSAPVGYFTFTDKALISEVNLTGASMLGVRRRNLIDNRFRAFVSSQDFDLWDSHFMKVLKQGEKQSCELAIRRVDDSVFYARLDSIRIDSDDGNSSVRCAMSDITEIRQTEALRESEEKFRLMFHRHQAIMLLIEPESGQILDANISAGNFYGYTIEELCRMSITDINTMPPEEIAAERKRVLTEERNYFIFTHRLASGEIRTVEVYSSPMMANEKKLLFSIIHDITERKIAEKALLDSARYTRNLIEASLDPLVTISDDGKITDVNKATESVTGYSREELIGSNFADYFTEPEKAKAGYSQVFETGLVRDYELHIRHKGGKIAPVLYNASVYRNEFGNIIGVFATARDISNRKRAEEALKASETRYRRLFESSKDGILILDAETGMIVDVNPFLIELLGFSHEAFRGKYIWELGFFRDIVANKDNFLELQQKEYIRYEDLPMETADGRQINAEFISNVYLVNRNKVIQCNIRDMTERKRLEEKRLELERRLLKLKKLESLGRVAAGISHNFNNILFAATGNMEMAMDQIPPTSSIRLKLENALKSVRRAADLTRKILAYSGSGFFTLQEIHISRLIKKNTDYFKSAMSETVSLSLNLTEDIPMIKADSEQIQQIILNMIVNSSEAIDKNVGTVILSTGVTNCYEDSLNNGLQRIDDPEEKPIVGRCVYIEISDTGCGITEEEINLLTDPFFTTKFMGRGLGMSEVQGIVSTHKGAILVKSKPGQGTTIRVLFPLSESVPKITELKPVHQEISQTDSLPKLILVVDDEEPIRGVCDMMLNRLGYRTLMAVDGYEAVEIFKVHSDDIHCVLLDLTMPNMDGISALKEMRRIRADVRIIISSGHSKEEISARFKDEGIKGILQKPFSLKDLRVELDAAIKS